ncbi:MAG TPA: TonB-dependent receptor, partial [Candidatus Polarisedimenticolia bacterium]
ADRDFQQDQSTLRTSGPFNLSYDRQIGRITLRQDLTVFVADWHGQHDMKFGGVVEREHYDQDTFLRPELYPKSRPSGINSHVTTIGVALPTEGNVLNNATSTTFGMYFQDTYKPLPNLTIGLGVRFDREATDSFGYTPFDPVAERNLYDSLRGLTADGELRLGDEKTRGNGDGLIAQGYCSDPIFINTPGGPCSTGNNVLKQLDSLKTIAKSRLTQHHFATALSASALESLFPDAIIIDPVTGERSINVELLRAQGATFEERQPFRLTNNNLAPRLSISWDPWGDSKTKVFGNWSRFYDKLFLNSVITEEGPDQITRYYKQDPDGVTVSGTPDNQIGTIVTKAPPDASQIDRGLQTPYSDEFTFGFERELAPEVSLKITYIQKQFRAQLQDRDINHTVRYDPLTGKALDQLGIISSTDNPNAVGDPAPDGRPDLYVENFFFNQIFRLGNFNHARYKGIEVDLTKRLSRKWQLDASYTYSRAIGNAEDFQSTLGDDPSSIREQFGYLNYDQRHSVKFNMITYLPGDWQVGGALSWQSGYPYSVIDRVFSLDSFSYPQQRTLFGQVVRTNEKPQFDPVQRNSRRNPAQYNIDLRAQRAFVLGRYNSKLFITVQNLLNTDDLRIFEYDPAAPDRGGALQVVSERRFGRRFEVGFQFEF